MLHATALALATAGVLLISTTPTPSSARLDTPR
jgi:hypothetical protein